MSDTRKARVVIGTRKSRLALWQANYIADCLRAIHPGVEVVLHHVVTQGDRVLDRPLPEIGGKGLFTVELESALRADEIDLAVHSFKDLPTEIAEDFVIGAIPERASPYDALISRNGQSLMALPKGATVGTSSLRRSAQIKAARPDLNTASLRGNVPTRIEKARNPDGPYDAIILAAAGLDRLGLDGHITEILAPDVMLPAPAQGALAVQCRADDAAIRAMLAPLDHTVTRLTVEAERAFLNQLDSGCRLPVAALARLDGSRLTLTGRVCNLDGSQVITVRGESPDNQAAALGRQLAENALKQGAGELLAAVEAAEKGSSE
jgi:hydroxymethylbilane synthase